MSSDSPLRGVRILDFSRLLPGPYATSILASLGAEVVKVEEPLLSDAMRHFPPLLNGTGVTFQHQNRGKQSVALDLKQEAGQDIAQRLAARSDVVVEGFRPGVAERLGIEFPQLSTCNPRLIYCSISGFGQGGEFRDLLGHDLTYAAMSGLRWPRW